MFVSLQSPLPYSLNSYVAILTSKVMVLKGGLWKVIRLWGGALRSWISALTEETSEISLFPATTEDIVRGQ